MDIGFAVALFALLWWFDHHAERRHKALLQSLREVKLAADSAANEVSKLRDFQEYVK